MKKILILLTIIATSSISFASPNIEQQVHEPNHCYFCNLTHSSVTEYISNQTKQLHKDLHSAYVEGYQDYIKDQAISLYRKINDTFPDFDLYKSITDSDSEPSMIIKF